MRNVHVVIALLPVLAACGTSLPESLRNPSSVDDLDRRIREHCASEGSADCEPRMAEAYCRHRGGSWVQFTNGCADSCDAQIAEGAGLTVTCTMDTPMDCGCGGDRCWDGLQCADLPPPAGKLEVDTVPPDDCFEPWLQPGEPVGDQVRTRLDRSEECLVAWFGAREAELTATDHPAARGILSCLQERMMMARSLAEHIREQLAGGDPDPRRIEVYEANWGESREKMAACAAY